MTGESEPSPAVRLRDVALLTAFAFALRALTVGNGTDLDTGCFLVMVRSMSEGQLLYRDILNNLPPLTFYLGRALLAISPGHFIETTRWAMILLSSASIIPVYLTAHRLFGRRTAVCAALVTALDLIGIFYARNLHVSVLEGAAAAWTLWFFLNGLAAQRRRFIMVLLAGVAAGTACAVKPSSVLLAPAFLALSGILGPDLRFDRSLRRAARDAPALALGFAAALAPWAAMLLVQGTLGDFVRSVASLNFHLRTQGVQSDIAGSLPAKLQLLAHTVRMNRWMGIMGVIGLIAICRRNDGRWALPCGMLLAYAVFFAFVYYESHSHYLLPWMPLLALPAGAGAAETWSWAFGGAVRTNRRTVASAVGLIAALAGTTCGILLLRIHRGDWASFAFVFAALATLKGIGLEAFGAEGAVVRRRARNGITAIMIAAVLMAYWSRRHVYLVPSNTLAQEREVAAWVRERVGPTADVAVLAGDSLTILGGWREPPVWEFGRPMIAPMWLDGAFRPWSPHPQMIADSIRYWEAERNVKAVVIREGYAAHIAATDPGGLRRYLEAAFAPVRYFTWPGVDAEDTLRVYLRRDALSP